jgi:hypothetical protein
MVLVLFSVLAVMTFAVLSQPPLIAIGGIMHEFDTFNPTKTSLSDFTRRRTTPPEQALAEWAKSNDEISGYNSILMTDNPLDRSNRLRHWAAAILRCFYRGVGDIQPGCLDLLVVVAGVH